MLLSITNESKGVIVAPRAKVAASLGSRFLGLLGTATLPEGEGLWLTPCRSIHTFFMNYPIDVAFIDKQGIVLVAKTMHPWKMSVWYARAAGVLELPAGTLERTRTAAGDKLTMRSI